MRPVHDLSLDEFEPLDDEPSRLSRLRRGLSTAIGACVALALLAGLGVWFYRLGARDAANVPIIRASAEPAKTRPEDPGGVVAPHQDITSYSVADSKPAQATAAVIAPPPPEPKREDVAMGTLPPEPVERPVARPPEAVEVAAKPREAEGIRLDGAPAAQPAPTSRPTAAEAAAAIASGAVRTRTAAIPSSEPAPLPAAPERAEIALAEAGWTDAPVATEQPGSAAPERMAVEPVPAEPTVTLATPEPAASEAVGAEAAPAEAAVDPVRDGSDYAPPLTPLAPPRPPDLKQRMVAAVQAAEQNASDLVRRAAESSVQVQLAADPSEDVVRAMWRRISNANSDLLHDRELAVQTTVSGGTKFYRLRVGPFDGVSEARAVCQALRARGQDCIVARNG